jgi:hypothetical protein
MHSRKGENAYELRSSGPGALPAVHPSGAHSWLTGA